MFFLITYDIPDDKRRTRIARTLEGHGERVQYSVFEMHLTEKQLEKLMARLKKIMQPKEDQVRVYRLCAACQQTVNVLGGGQLTPPPQVQII